MSPIPSPLSGVAHTGMGNLFVEWNYRDQAENELRCGIELGRKWANQDAEINGYTGLVRSRLAAGDHHGAQELIDELVNLIKNSKIPWSMAMIDGLQAKTWMQQKQLEPLQAWATRKALALEGGMPYILEEQAIILARAQITLGQFQLALSLIERVLPATEAGSRWGRTIELRLLQSLIWFHLGKSSLAFESLESAFQATEAEGYLRLFLDEGEPMERLLTSYADQPSARFQDYAISLLAAFTKEKIRIPTGTTDLPLIGSSALIEPLSEREMEVLRLIAAGLNNQEISARLVVSLNTIKSISRTFMASWGSTAARRPSSAPAKQV